MVITLLNFDNTLTCQEELRRFPYKVVEMGDIPGTRLYCSRDALREIAARLKKTKMGITLIGSGDFHYVSYLLASYVKTPFALILFDNHADLQPLPRGVALSCASWLRRAIELPALKKALLIGPRALPAGEKIPPQYLTKLIFLPKAYHTTLVRALKEVPPNVYISIDKDVLSPEEVITNWDQGALTLQELLSALREIMRVKNVIGADICGEPYFSPVSILLPSTQKAVRKNSRANAMILKTLMPAFTYEKAS
ncbi:arginase family protein [Neomoorella humiferrea]|uniref:arginase family protein n=1 Tax=Neomoorella humiferrea TaxID=676965 RepID=UPI003D8DC810